MLRGAAAATVLEAEKREQLVLRKARGHVVDADVRGVACGGQGQARVFRG